MEKNGKVYVLTEIESAELYRSIAYKGEIPEGFTQQGDVEVLPINNGISRRKYVDTKNSVVLTLEYNSSNNAKLIGNDKSSRRNITRSVNKFRGLLKKFGEAA